LKWHDSVDCIHAIPTCTSTVRSSRQKCVLFFLDAHEKVVVLGVDGVVFKVSHVNAQSLTRVRCQHIYIFVACTQPQIDRNWLLCDNTQSRSRIVVK